jgi:hypothetical protein
MTYPVIEPRDEQSSESAGRVVGTFFAFVFLVGGFVLFALSFSGGEHVSWVFLGAIASITLAFMIPTTILPAIEGD